LVRFFLLLILTVCSEESWFQNFWTEFQLPIVDRLPCACRLVEKKNSVEEDIGHVFLRHNTDGVPVSEPLRLYGGVACIHFECGARYIHFKSVGLQVQKEYLKHTTEPNWQLWYAFRECPSGVWSLPKLVECYR
jgi:hypothetical protein